MELGPQYNWDILESIVEAVKTQSLGDDGKNIN